MIDRLLFYLFGFVAVVGAIGVLLNRRVFYSALSLIVCLAALSGVYMVLESPFIAAVQVIVYAGAIMVLFLFVIMLLDPFAVGVLKDKKRSLLYLGPIVAVSVLAMLYPLLRTYDPGRAMRGVQDTEAAFGSVKIIGETLFRDYLLPFEVTSVLILVAIIGVVVLAKRQS